MGYALIDGCRETVLINSGARANAIMPEYCVKHELKVRPVYELAMNPTLIPVSGIGGITLALGYAIINVQIPGRSKLQQRTGRLSYPRCFRTGDEGASHSRNANDLPAV